MNKCLFCFIQSSKIQCFIIFNQVIVWQGKYIYNTNSYSFGCHLDHRQNKVQKNNTSDSRLLLMCFLIRTINCKICKFYRWKRIYFCVKKPSLFSRRGRLRRPVPPSPSVGKPTALSDVVPFRYIGRSPRRTPCFCPAERPFAHCFRPLFNPLGIERMDFCAP